MKFYASFPITVENCLSNRGMSYGDGLFETLLVVKGVVPLWEWHYQRLELGLIQLNISPPSNKKLLEKIYSLTDDLGEYVVKLVVFRDDSKRAYASDSKKARFYISLNPYNRTNQPNEITVSSVQLAKQKKTAGLKHLNRLEQVLAAQELSGTGYVDALMLDGKRRMIETISKNIILIKGKDLYTPMLNNCGVYGVALRWLQAQGYALIWKKIEFESVSQYDGLIVCNSVVGFHAIAKVNNIHFNNSNSIVDEIQNKWQKYINY